MADGVWDPRRLLAGLTRKTAIKMPGVDAGDISCGLGLVNASRGVSVARLGRLFGACDTVFADLVELFLERKRANAR